MWVGINYPWCDYGWDFGEPLPTWGPRARWRSVIAEHLTELRRVGIRVVRWFIVADGLSYGTSRNAPRLHDGHWRFSPPDVASDLLDDFSTLLDVFHGSGFLLLPVLIDFHFAKDGEERRTGYVSGGRAQALVDPSARRQLLSNLLEPLLERSRRHPSSIYAWELINEPEGCTDTGASDRGEFPTVPLAEMMRFLREGTHLIADYGFSPTVGYRRPVTPIRWHAIETSRRLSGTMQHVPRIPAILNLRPFGESYWQFHYYPDGSTPPGFPARTDVVGTRNAVILGEFATKPGRDTWPDLGFDQSIAARLTFARDRGITVAIPWSFQARLRAQGHWSGPATEVAAAGSRDDRTATDWRVLADDILRFTGGGW